MNTQQELFIEKFWDDCLNVYEVIAEWLTDEEMDLIDAAILEDFEADTAQEPQLDNDFGEVYWNGTRMVPKPEFEDAK